MSLKLGVVLELADFLQFNSFNVIFLIAMSKRISFLDHILLFHLFTCGQDRHRETHGCLYQKQPFSECGLTLYAMEAMPFISAIPLSSSAHG